MEETEKNGIYLAFTACQKVVLHYSYQLSIRENLLATRECRWNAFSLWNLNEESLLLNEEDQGSEDEVTAEAEDWTVMSKHYVNL